MSGVIFNLLCLGLYSKINPWASNPPPPPPHSPRTSVKILPCGQESQKSSSSVFTILVFFLVGRTVSVWRSMAVAAVEARQRRSNKTPDVQRLDFYNSRAFAKKAQCSLEKVFVSDPFPIVVFLVWSVWSNLIRSCLTWKGLWQEAICNANGCIIRFVPSFNLWLPPTPRTENHI